MRRNITLMTNPHTRKLLHTAYFSLFFAMVNMVMPAVSFAQNFAPETKQKVFIAGVEVVSKEAMLHNTLKEELPTELQSTRSRMAIENRVRIKVYDHAPVIGPEKAPVTFVEFNDLSCETCREISKTVDEIRKKHPKSIRHIYIHTPIDAYNATNPAAFYGRIAAFNHKFWQYREALYSQSQDSDNIYIDTLIKLGIDMKKIRQDIRENARQFYKEIDADTALAASMGEKTAPSIYLNGIRLGGSISLDDADALVNYELSQYKKRQ